MEGISHVPINSLGLIAFTEASEGIQKTQRSKVNPHYASGPMDGVLLGWCSSVSAEMANDFHHQLLSLAEES